LISEAEVELVVMTTKFGTVGYTVTRTCLFKRDYVSIKVISSFWLGVVHFIIRRVK